MRLATAGGASRLTFELSGGLRRTCWPLARCVDLASAINLLGTLGSYLAKNLDVRAPAGAAACTKLLCMRRLVATCYLPVSANAKRAAE